MACVGIHPGVSVSMVWTGLSSVGPFYERGWTAGYGRPVAGQGEKHLGRRKLGRMKCHPGGEARALCPRGTHIVGLRAGAS